MASFVDSLPITDVYQEDDDLFFKVNDYPMRLNVNHKFIVHDPDLRCPVCSGKIVENETAFACKNYTHTHPCFIIFKFIMGKRIDKKIVKDLIQKGETKVLSSFISRTQKNFQAKLALNGTKVEFKFDLKAESDTKEENVRCPLCKEEEGNICKALSNHFDELFEKLKTFNSIRLLWVFK